MLSTLLDGDVDLLELVVDLVKPVFVVGSNCLARPLHPVYM